jgi:hypothetical protein
VSFVGFVVRLMKKAVHVVEIVEKSAGAACASLINLRAAPVSLVVAAVR